MPDLIDGERTPDQRQCVRVMLVIAIGRLQSLVIIKGSIAGYVTGAHSGNRHIRFGVEGDGMTTRIVRTMEYAEWGVSRL